MTYDAELLGRQLVHAAAELGRHVQGLNQAVQVARRSSAPSRHQTSEYRRLCVCVCAVTIEARRERVRSRVERERHRCERASQRDMAHSRDVLVRQADEARGRATIRRSVSTRPAREAQRHKLDGAIERVVVEIEQIADHDRERRERSSLVWLCCWCRDKCAADS